MTQDDSEIPDRLTSLRQAYELSLHDKVARLVRSGRDVHVGNEAKTRASMNDARFIAHKIAGSAATFGFNDIGRVARLLEDCLNEILANPKTPGESARRELEALLQDILREELEAKKHPAESAQSTTGPSKSGEAAASSLAHRVLVSQSQHALARDLAVALSNCGFEAQVCDEPDVVVKHAEALRPDVLIIAVGEEPARDFAIAETIWSNPSFRGLEIVFIANSQELRRKILRNGISDEWFVTTSADLQAFSAALLRRVFNVKVGREVCNRAWLMPFLPTLKELSASETAATPPWRTFAAKRSGARAAGSAVCKGKILVVDDDRHLVELVAEVLSTNGFEPVKAYSGFQALQLATKEKPDLIITDFEMANGSGEYLIANLKMSSVTNAIKVLLMTRANVFEKYGLEDDAVSRLNVVACLRKPLDMNALVAEVETNLASAWR